nr:hypothetical protein [Tanacetum cinerariifolium]
MVHFTCLTELFLEGSDVVLRREEIERVLNRGDCFGTTDYLVLILWSSATWKLWIHSHLLPTDHLQPLWPHHDDTDLFVTAIHGGCRWWSVGDVGDL